tara:strand:+ start:845 stop:1147 length:303 start_codon:yes stop_codon:yes gene_type:complete
MNMNLKNLYGTFLEKGNSPEAFIANVIYERYGKDRKKMLQGLYNIINGGPKHYWAPCDVRFADWSMETIICTPLCCNENYTDDPMHRQKEVDIHNLKFYA